MENRETLEIRKGWETGRRREDDMETVTAMGKGLALERRTERQRRYEKTRDRNTD